MSARRHIHLRRIKGDAVGPFNYHNYESQAETRLGAAYVPFSMNLFVVINFRLTATYVFFHKLWLIYPGLAREHFYLIYSMTSLYRDQHQFPHWLIAKC